MFIVLGIILGFVLAYICLKPKLKQTKELDRQIEERNKIAQQTYEKLTNDVISAKIKLSEINAECGKGSSMLALIQKEIERAGENAKTAAQAVEEAATATMQNHFDAAVERSAENYRKATESYQIEYQMAMREATKGLTEKLNELKLMYENKYNEFSNLEAIVNAAVEANKREQEKKDQQNFYRLRLSEDDIKEIKKLREVAQYLRDSEPLNKVIYKVYYENPCTDLIGRVVGLNSKEVKTGIYKITNLENGMCYVGQAVNIADRWRQHVKRGTGADTPTRNKLYPAMLEFGIENFSFEIIEECSREMLNEREQFWQEYFKAKEFGYSIK